QLQYLKSYNITDILLCVGYLGENIQNYFGDGQSWDVRIKYSFEETPIGTGGALKNAKDHLEDRFFLIYGDSFLPIDYSSLEKHFLEIDKMALMVLYDNREDTSVPNNISLDNRGLVRQYEKNTGNSILQYVDAGVLALKKDILDIVPSERTVSLEKEIFPDLIARQECAGFVTLQRFYDIGSPERLKRFETYIKQHCN
ncbi:MAG: hypothetical protein SCARUB_00987, partial [Candidatus Scalindua rubra]